MDSSLDILRVYPNPWSARDKQGVPCGVCPRDPESDGGSPGQFVGARVDRKRTHLLQELKKGDDLRSPIQRTFYEFMGIASDDPELATKLFSAAPIEVPRTKYYRARLRDRSLIPADAETAKAGKLRFIPIADRLKCAAAPQAVEQSPEPVAAPETATQPDPPPERSKSKSKFTTERADQ